MSASWNRDGCDDSPHSPSLCSVVLSDVPISRWIWIMTLLTISDMAPHVVVSAGPNGAGKSTMAPLLLRDELRVGAFVNADVIALGLSAFRPEAAAIDAGRTMIEHMQHLAERRVTFAFETTLAGRTVALQLERLRSAGYATHLIYLWLPSADYAVGRVRRRVALGGHSVPEDVVRRRYQASLKNLRRLYLPLMTSWRVYNSSLEGGPHYVARGAGDVVHQVWDADAWRQITSEGD
jgi:predicted ABC-type ATPase